MLDQPRDATGIGFRVGYSDVSHVSHDDKKHFGRAGTGHGTAEGNHRRHGPADGGNSGDLRRALPRGCGEAGGSGH